MPNPQRRFAVAALLFLPLLPACSGGDAPRVDHDAEESAIRGLSSRWLESTRARDAQAVAALFAADGVALDAGSPAVIGPQAVAADVARDWAANPDFTIDWSTRSVEVAASGDLAWERGEWSFDADGDGPRRGTLGEFVTVWRKSDDGWKVAYSTGAMTEPAP